MTRELVLAVWDDLERKNGRNVVAETTRTLSYQGRTVELDLTNEHARELDRQLKHWLDAGSPAGTAAAPSDMAASREYNKGMREFADAHGFSYEGKKAGGFYYSRELQRAYREHLAEQEKRGAA